MIKPFIQKMKSEHDKLLKEVNDSLKPNLSSSTIESYLEILRNQFSIDMLIKEGYHLLSISGLITNKIHLNVIKAKMSGKIKEELEDKIKDAEEKLTSTKNLLYETYENLKSYQGFEWLIFAYTYLRDAETSANLLRAREAVDSELFFHACLAIEMCNIFTDFIDLIKTIDEKGKKADDIKKSMKDFAFTMIQTAEYDLKTVTPEHVNNPDEEALLIKTINYLVPVMTKMFTGKNYLVAIDTAQLVIFNAELIKAAFVQAPQSYIRSLMAQKLMEFNELISKTREKGKFDAILPIFYYEKAAGPLGEPSRMIASANLSMALIGIMEKELKPSAMFTI
ncbi:MAG: hypothetical protein ACUVXA_10515 [Candidatus Jordarchaeum sp.]|uniref:hypothetical protein n=1 Tax=Candidatus Jordarchaeum sp. TaxID=2823881 RepID=UPI004049C11D